MNEGLREVEGRLAALLRDGLAGDARAYRAFLTELSTRLRGYFRRRLARLPDEVEDLVQETLLAVHNQRNTYDAGQPMTAWVHAIARYKLIDLLRRRASRGALDVPLEDDAAWLAAPALEPLEAHRDLMALLEALPDRHRLPILCTKIEGLSVAEAARRLGMSESAVKVGVHRGLKALAEKIRRGE